MAPCICRRLKISYFPCPKNAGTSIRHALYLCEFGQPYHGYDLYRVFGTGGPFQAECIPGHERITVIRDPVARLVSAFTNRVLRYGEINRQAMRKSGIPDHIPDRPNFEQFVLNLSYYRNIVEIHHHTNPQVFFLGNSLSFYDHVFSVDGSDELEKFLSKKAGHIVKLPRYRVTSADEKAKIAISDQLRERIKNMYQMDYDLISQKFRLLAG